MKKKFLKKNQIYCGDCLKVMKRIRSGSVDMILCDLPYGMTSCQWDTPIVLEKLWKRYEKIIKDNGIIVLTACQPFTSVLIMSNINMFKYCWVWAKTKPSGYQIAKIKPLSRYEDIAVFGKGKICYNPQMVPRNKPRTGMVHRTNRQMKISGGGIHREYKEYTHKYPTTIIEISNAVQIGKIHPTQKPVLLFEYLIKTYTNKGDLVLDNCAGSGTTGVACKNLNRDFILIEKEEKYCRLAHKRVFDKKMKRLRT